jgi:ABC-type multidrug transport system fused ATPase/permease subunit
VLIKDPIYPVDIKPFENKISFNDVSFSYVKEDGKTVLKNINLYIPKGKTVALVGQSGSGKTTLADMLPRYYDVDLGSITIDGINIKDLRITDLRGLMGIVTQESILFNDTVFNNIAFGMENATEADVIAAAKIANENDFITAMSEGYQTTIGDRGSKLSGGQRQRLSIARAVLKNPPILILDEATSSIDSESEELIQNAIETLVKGRTSIVIAHRLSTIRHAHKIMVLDKSELKEFGTHEELLAMNGYYKKLYDMQFMKKKMVA